MDELARILAFMAPNGFGGFQRIELDVSLRLRRDRWCAFCGTPTADPPKPTRASLDMDCRPCTIMRRGQQRGATMGVSETGSEVLALVNPHAAC
jgi:hypothetical protein